MLLHTFITFIHSFSITGCGKEQGLGEKTASQPWDTRVASRIITEHLGLLEWSQHPSSETHPVLCQETALQSDRVPSYSPESHSLLQQLRVQQ